MTAAFPPARSDVPGLPADLAAQGLFLRALCEDDLPWLRELYASTREEELAVASWPAATKQAFVEQQFDLQHRHYMAGYGDADFLGVVRDDRPLGRLYLRRTPPEHLIVDISLFPQARGQGIGTALLEATQACAAAQGCGMGLHVLQHNPAARRLYERLGFVAREAVGPYWRMDWRARV